MKKFKINFNFKFPSLKQTLKILLIVAVIIGVILCLKYFIKGDDGVKFNILSEEEIPQKIALEVLPEYQQLERALACYIDDKVYVIATRGEKPTGGYNIEIDNIRLIKEEENSKLVVYTIFTDPKPGSMVTQVITYPHQIAETNLKSLPNEIELKVQYKD